MADASADCPAEPMDAEQLLYLLYTSGTTGQAQGHHAHHRRLSHPGRTYTHKYVFDVKPDEDVYWCSRRHRLGHRPQLHRLRPAHQRLRPQVMYEGTPDTPRPEFRDGDRADWPKDRLWDIIEKLRASPSFYTAPDRHPDVHEVGHQGATRSTTCRRLRVLGTVGEPINPEAWMWYHEHIGGESLSRSSTRGGRPRPADIMISAAAPASTVTKPGSATFSRSLGSSPSWSTINGNRRRTSAADTSPSPAPGRAMLRGIWGNPERYRRDLLVHLRGQATSPATAPRSTRTVTSGSSAESTTS